MTEEDYIGTIFKTLQSQKRRHSLTYLQQKDTHAASVDDIAEYLSGETEERPEDIRTSLRHHHLPRLENHGWINYDERSETVSNMIISEDTRDGMLLDYLTAAEESEDEEYLNDVFATLADSERRRILYTLEHEENQYSTLNGLTALMTMNPAEQDSVKTSLHHVHLPQLDDLGWVEYNRDTQEVTLSVTRDMEPDGILLDYIEQAYED